MRLVVLIGVTLALTLAACARLPREDGGELWTRDRDAIVSGGTVRGSGGGSGD